MAPTAAGSKARVAPPARRKACMGWSWAAGPQRAAYRGAEAYRGGLPPTACYAPPLIGGALSDAFV